MSFNSTSIAALEDMARQASAVAGLAALVWGTATGMPLLEALFRGVIIYLILNILLLALKGVWLRLQKAPQPRTGAAPDDGGEEAGV